MHNNISPTITHVRLSRICPVGVQAQSTHAMSGNKSFKLLRVTQPITVIMGEMQVLIAPFMRSMVVFRFFIEMDADVVDDKLVKRADERASDEWTDNRSTMPRL